MTCIEVHPSQLQALLRIVFFGFLVGFHVIRNIILVVIKPGPLKPALHLAIVCKKQGFSISQRTRFPFPGCAPDVSGGERSDFFFK